MDDIYTFNSESIKQKYSDFLNEESNFNNSTYSTFNSSYIKSNSDHIITSMANDLDYFYNRIQNAYNNISDWWKDYIENVDYIENTLSGNSVPGLHCEDSVRSYILNNLSEINAPSIEIVDIGRIDTTQFTALSTAFATSTLSYSEQLKQYQEAQNALYAQLEGTEDELSNLLDKFIDENFDLVKDKVELSFKMYNNMTKYNNVGGLTNSDSKVATEANLKKFFKENLANYMGDLSSEFESVFGISYDEYLYTVSYIDYQKNIIEAQQYEIRQNLKAAPYYDMMETDEFIKYKEQYQQKLQSIVSGDYEAVGIDNFTANDGNRLMFVDAYKKYGDESNYTDMFNSFLDTSNYEYLTEEERMLYSYIYETEGASKAQEFMSSLEDKINKQRGLDEANSFIESITVENALYNTILHPTDEAKAKLTESDLEWLKKANAEVYQDNISSDDVFSEIVYNFHNITMTKGAAAGKQYINDIQNYLRGNNQLLGFELKDNFEQYGKATIKGVKDGVDGFFDGTVSFTTDVLTQNEYSQSYIASYLSDELGLNVTYNVSSSVGRMLPTMALSYALGPLGTTVGAGKLTVNTAALAAQTVQAYSMFGSGMHESLVEGKSQENAFIDGIISASSEFLVGSALGSVPKVFDIKSVGGNTLKKVLAEYIKDGIGEGAEEFVQTYVDAGVNFLRYKEEVNMDELNMQALQSFGYGMATGLILGGGELSNNLTDLKINGKGVNVVDFMDFVNQLSNDPSINPDTMINVEEAYQAYLERNNNQEVQVKFNFEKEIALINENSDNKQVSVLNIKNLNDMSLEELHTISVPGLVNFKLSDGKTYTYSQVEYMIKNPGKELPSVQSYNADIKTETKSLDEQIAIANYYAKRGNTTAIELNSLNDMTLEEMSLFDNPELTLFKMNGQTYTFNQMSNLIANTSMEDVINGKISPSQNNAQIKSLDEQITIANYYAKRGNTTAVELNSLNDMTLEEMSLFDNPELTLFKMNGQTYTFNQMTELIVNTSMEDVINMKPSDSIFTNANTVAQVGEIAFDFINSNIQSLLNNKVSSLKTIAGIISAFVTMPARFKYNSVKGTDVSSKIQDTGLYHFTSEEVANKIITSGYIKASSAGLTSYGSSKAFFFSGVPSLEQYLVNLDTFRTKVVAVKLKVNENTSSDFLFRPVDGAIAYKGDYHFNQQDAEIAYFGLFEENGNLVYKEIPKEQYDSYTPNISTSKINQDLNAVKGAMIAVSEEYEYLKKMINKATNSIFNSMTIDKIKNNSSRFFKGLTGTISSAIGGGMLLDNLVLILPGLGLFLPGLKVAQDAMLGNYVKNSSFIIQQNKKLKTGEKVDYIYQNLLSYKENLAAFFESDKQKYFMLQALNMFQQLPKERYGQTIKYGTESQAFTYMLLKTMKSEGYITNLTKEKSRLLSLGLERLTLGVEQRNKKTQMFNMTFELTDKKLDAEAITKIIEKLKMDVENYKVKIDKDGNIIYMNSTSLVDILKNKLKLFTSNKISSETISDVENELQATIKEQEVKSSAEIIMESGEATTEINLSKIASGVSSITKQNLAEKIDEAIQSNNSLELFMQDVLKCTENDISSDFESLMDLKKSIAQYLKDSGKISALRPYQVLLFTQDYEILSNLIGTDALSNLISEHLFSENKSDVSEICRNLKKLNQEQFHILFSNMNIQDSISTATDLGIVVAINAFISNGDMNWLNNKMIVNSILKLSPYMFYSLNLRGILNVDINSIDSENYIDFLSAIDNNFFTTEVFMRKADLLTGLISLIPADSASIELSNIRNKLIELRKSFDDKIYENIITNSDVLLPSDLVIRDLEQGKYYTITYEVNGVEDSYTWLNSLSSEVDIKGKLILLKLEEKILSGEVKIKNFECNDKKNQLILGQTSGILERGLYRIKLIVDGTECNVIASARGFPVTCNLNSMFDNINTVQLLSVEYVESKNFEVDDVDSVYKMTYELNGSYYEKILPVHSLFGSKTVDVDKFILDNQLVDITNVQIMRVNLSDVNGPGLSTISQNDTNILSSSKYGGNQSDVYNIVNKKYSNEVLSNIDDKKADLIISLAKKYFPNISDKRIVDIAAHYATGGCSYMANANAFMLYMASIENGSKIFKDKFGYELCFTDGENISYNLEALAFEIYLNRFSAQYNSDSVELLLLGGSGVNGLDSEWIYKTFFESKGIKIDKTDITASKNNLISSIVSNTLNYNNSFIVLNASNFDLELLSAGEFSGNLDAALANSTSVGKVKKGIKGHAMLVTGIDSENNVIVSSWSKKYKFLLENLADRDTVSFDRIRFSILE